MTCTTVKRIAIEGNRDALIECLRSVYTDFRPLTTLDQCLDELGELADAKDFSTLAALAETLLASLPSLGKDFEEVWHFVGEILKKLPRGANNRIENLIIALRECIRDLTISDPPVLTDAKARAAAIQVSMQAGCEYFVSHFKKAHANELFENFPSVMIYYALRLSNKNFTDVADLMVEQVAAGAIPLHEMVFWLPEFLDAVHRHLDRRSSREYWWRIYQAYANAPWPEGTGEQFDEKVKSRWPDFGTRPEIVTARKNSVTGGEC